MVARNSSPPAPTSGGKMLTPEQYKENFIRPASPKVDPSKTQVRSAPAVAAQEEWPKCGLCPAFKRFGPRGTVGECLANHAFSPIPFLRGDMDTCSYTLEERETYAKTGGRIPPPQPVRAA